MVRDLKDAGTGRKGRRRAALSVGFLLLGAGLLFFYFYIYRVEPAFSEMTYEYGTLVSRDVGEYLTGTDWSVRLGELDLSQVDEGEPGVYEAFVRHGRSRFVYTIMVQDTAAPEIRWREDPVYLASGAVCTVGDVVDGIEDADREAQVFFLKGGEELSEVCFDSVGAYRLEVLARDRSGNETRGTVDVTVDTPPVLKGIRDIYMVPGSRPDCGDGVTAMDDVDGDLTESIRIDDSGVRWEEAGQYALRYLSADSYGLETVETAQVLVAPEEEIQELIGRRRIDYREDFILGAPNVYDGGASDREDMEETLEHMKPALVQLYHATGRGGYSSGSGYIMEITEDAVYICTNSHVIEESEDWDVYFYDGTKVRGKKMGVSEAYDVGVVELALEEVPETLLDRLMTVHIDRTYWEGLDRQAIELALERVDREGGLLHVSRGRLVKVKQEFSWYDMKSHTEVTVKLVKGDSGSALLDGYGNLVGMAFAYSIGPVRYWCVPLDGILECYQEITGRMPYVY